MTTQEHLNKIKAKCEQLLAIAAKRTPGKWTSQIYDSISAAKHEGFFEWASPINSLLTGPVGMVWSQNGNATTGLPGSIEASADNVTFIASCAGTAEAGWRATIAAIDWVTHFSQVDLSPCNGGSCAVATEVDERLDSVKHHSVLAILVAWPEELLV